MEVITAMGNFIMYIRSHMHALNQTLILIGEGPWYVKRDKFGKTSDDGYVFVFSYLIFLLPSF